MPAEESPVEESVVEDTPAEETLVEQTSAEPVPIDNIAPGISNEGDVSMDTEEDGPLEDWTVKELKEECKSLGLAEKGKKADLVERIKAHRAATEVAEEVTTKESQAEEAPIEKSLLIEQSTLATLLVF